MSPSDETQRPRLIPVPKWPHHLEWPSVGGLRHLIFHAKEHNFENVFIRCGRRILIDEDAFFRWARASTAMAQGRES